MENHLKSSDILLVLVSSSFLSSSFFLSDHMLHLFQRSEAGEIALIPILVRPSGWSETPLGKLQPLPTNGKSIVEWRDRDQAFQEVARGIAKVVTDMYEARATPRLRLPRPMVSPKPLTAAERERALLLLPGWKMCPLLLPGSEPARGIELVKTYQFANYDVALGFVTKASEYIAMVQHHPTWEITWGTVTARITTWDIGNQLSHYDLELATYLDALSQEYPPPRRKK